MNYKIWYNNCCITYIYISIKINKDKINKED